jgi:hypothetical protein
MKSGKGAMATVPSAPWSFASASKDCASFSDGVAVLLPAVWKLAFCVVRKLAYCVEVA